MIESLDKNKVNSQQRYHKIKSKKMILKLKEYKYKSFSDFEKTKQIKNNYWKYMKWKNINSELQQSLESTKVLNNSIKKKII